MGIDKKCDENYILTKDSLYNFHDYINSESIVLMVEGFLLSLSGIFIITQLLCIHCHNKDKKDFKEIVVPELMRCLYCIYMVIFIICFIIKIVYFCKIKKYDLSHYDCSDSKTNELIKKVAYDDYKQIIYVG